MKVGNHAGEDWDDILQRKRRELAQSGSSFWGYGGRACHPITQIQPFARLAIREGQEIQLLMEQIDSQAVPDIIPATQFSRDGLVWEPLPKGVEVIGSRYAMVLGEIRPGDLEIPFNEYEVAIGPSRGKAAEAYVRARTDKACMVRSARPREATLEREKLVHKIRVVATLKDPFAVLLR